MKSKARLPYLLFVVMTVLALMLSACQSATATATVEPTTASTEAPTVAPTATTPPPVCTKLADAPAAPAAGALGSADNPIVMAFVPSGESGTIATASSAIADCLNQMTGLTYSIQTGTSYAAAIEAMGAGKAQVGFLKHLLHSRCPGKIPDYPGFNQPAQVCHQ